jgi:protein-glutamine gamma-glutamyltransferase
MLKISNEIIKPESINEQYQENSIERKIIEILSSSDEVYKYNSINHLKFELNLRVNIILASKELNSSDFSFKIFRKSICNEKYWTRTLEGGFLLKSDAKPSEAINDIYENSDKYGTECATAIVIVYYKAILNIFPEKLFDETFPILHLMNWSYIDSDLDINSYRDLKDYLPGDCRYIKNPDVDPKHPEWQGENAIDLGDGRYYGHGVGIKTLEEIINTLNRLRKDGATEIAYLLESATRPNIKRLSDIYLSYMSKTQQEGTRVGYRSYMDWRNTLVYLS